MSANSSETSDFVEVICHVSSAVAEPLVDWWLTQNALAVTCCDAGNQPILEPIPQSMPLWPDVKVIAIYPKREAFHLEPLVTQLKQTFSISTYQVREARSQDWSEAWKQHATPQHLGNGLWLCSSAHAPPKGEHCTDTICLDPGLAFGTGQHPTTRLCLEWIAHQRLTGKTVLDVGCGSGILSIAALKCHAARVIACDIDLQAIEATQKNSELNGISASQLHTVWIKDLQCRADYFQEPVHLILANLVAAPLIELASAFINQLTTEGQLLLAGLLKEETKEVMAAYAPAIQFETPRYREEWSLLVGRKL